MGAKLRKLKQIFNGLHLSVKRKDTIEVEHNGEKLFITVLGKQGTDLYSISFNGPDTFKIMSPKYKEKINQTESK